MAKKPKEEIVPPTAEEMRTFANQFSKATWAKLCKNKRFMNLVDSDLKKCQDYATEFVRKFELDKEND